MACSCPSGNDVAGAGLPLQKAGGQDSGPCVCQQKQVLLERQGLCLGSWGWSVSCEQPGMCFPDKQDVFSS